MTMTMNLELKISHLLNQTVSKNLEVNYKSCHSEQQKSAIYLLRQNCLDSVKLAQSPLPESWISSGLEQPLVIAMVGLPARGKSYLIKMITRYLKWTGFEAK